MKRQLPLFSESRGWRILHALFVVSLLAADGGAAGIAARQEEPPPIVPPEPIAPPEAVPPPDAIEASPPRSKPLPVKEAIEHCQRCGYVINDGWRYCPACGWDHRALAGDAAGERLMQIQTTVMGIVVVKDKLGFEALLSPAEAAQFRRYLGGSGVVGQTKSFGSALPYGRDGVYVTSARILQRGKTVQLRNFKNHFVDAEIVGYDIPSGIGVVKADIVNPDSQPLASAEGHVSEERAWVVCYPVDEEDDLVQYLPASIHSGRIVDRGYFGTHIVSHENLLRTDHTLPDGCSGGLLIDSLGLKAGIVLGSPDQGVTYAQPLADVVPMIEALASGAPIERPYYGLGLVTPDERHHVRFNLPPGTRRPVVAFLIDGSPAQIAGVRRGDVVVAIDGEDVIDVVSVGARLLEKEPGGTPARLTLQRGGSQIDVVVRPVPRAARVMLDPIDEILETLQTNLVEVKTGRSSGHGLRVEQLLRGGRGERLGFSEGDVIRKVEHHSVRDFQTFNRIVSGENPDLFDGEQSKEDIPARQAYTLSLEVRTVDGENRGRPYMSFFPGILAPPVY